MKVVLVPSLRCPSHAVPNFLVNKRFFVIGAQCIDSLVNVFDRAMFGAESDLEVSETIH